MTRESPALPSMQVLPALVSHDGLQLFRRQWLHPEARGAILLVHGLGEHSGRYQALAEWFWRRGFTVQAYDQRGHGRSQGARGGLAKADDLLRDLAQVHELFAGTMAVTPLLLGHSMGGLVCARAVLDRRVSPAGLVLSAPALRSHAGPVLEWLASLLSRLTPGWSMRQGLPRKYLSHDPSVAPAMLADAYCHERITPALADFIFKAGAACRSDAGELAVDSLLLVAGDDHLVDPAGSTDFAARAPAERLQTRIFASAYHELFNEIASLREPVLAALGAWLDARVPAT